MSCGCENRKKAMDLERTRRLAKALARLEKQMVYIYQFDDGSYGFDIKCNLKDMKEQKVIEYITHY